MFFIKNMRMIMTVLRFRAYMFNDSGVQIFPPFVSGENWCFP